MTIFVYSVLNRSLCLTKAFITLIKEKNFIAASPLIRLQLDNVLRFFASGIYSNNSKFVEKVLNGEQINKLKDRNGNKMTDSYLLKLISDYEGLEWIKNIYEETSGYIHLSDKHVFNSLRSISDKGKFDIKVSGIDEFIPEISYIKAKNTYRLITILLLDLIDLWLEQLTEQIQVQKI